MSYPYETQSVNANHHYYEHNPIHKERVFKNYCDVKSVKSYLIILERPLTQLLIQSDRLKIRHINEFRG
jgi:hypothetical protein